MAKHNNKSVPMVLGLFLAAALASIVVLIIVKPWCKKCPPISAAFMRALGGGTYCSGAADLRPGPMCSDTCASALEVCKREQPKGNWPADYCGQVCTPATPPPPETELDPGNIAGKCSSSLVNKKGQPCINHFSTCCAAGCVDNERCKNTCVSTGSQYCIPDIDERDQPGGGGYDDGGGYDGGGGSTPPTPTPPTPLPPLPRPYIDNTARKGFLSTTAGKATMGVGAVLSGLLLLVLVVMAMKTGKRRR